MNSNIILKIAEIFSLTNCEPVHFILVLIIIIYLIGMGKISKNKIDYLTLLCIMLGANIKITFVYYLVLIIPLMAYLSKPKKKIDYLKIFLLIMTICFSLFWMNFELFDYLKYLIYFTLFSLIITISLDSLYWSSLTIKKVRKKNITRKNVQIEIGGHDPTFNILSFIAIFFIFILNGRANITKSVPSSGIWYYLSFLPAWAGVWIFFILAGYAICSSFMNKKYSITDINGNLDKQSLLQFYYKKFITLAPMYFIFCIIFEIFSGNHFFWNNKKVLLHIITFTYNGVTGITGTGNHLWVISTLMQLYILMPFIYLLIQKITQKKHLISSLYITLIGGLFIRLFLQFLQVSWHKYVYTNFLVNLDLVIVGMLVAKINQAYRIKFNNRKHKKRLLSCSVLLFLCLVIFNCYIYSCNYSGYNNIYKYIFPTAYATIIAIILICFNEPLYIKVYNVTARIKNTLTTVVNCFSKYSYAFYILHLAVFHYVRLSICTPTRLSAYPLLTQYFLFYSISAIITYGLSIIVTKWYETLNIPHLKKYEDN